MTLAGKAALVTGSTSGIGLAIARALAGAGANVTLNGFGAPDAIEAICSELRATTPSAIDYVPADVAHGEQAEALVRAAMARWGSLDILVNNAGVQFVAPVDEFPPDQWDRLLAVNLSASFHTIRTVLPEMKRRRYGRIINIASVHGLVASPFKSAYAASKHGLVGLTRAVALEVAEFGITCNAICPGYVRTPLVEGQVKDQARVHKLPEERVVREILLAAQPTREFVEMSEVVEVMLLLCSPSARSITGAAWTVDGGWTAR